MLVLGGFVLRRQNIVPLNLTDDRQAVDAVLPRADGHTARVVDSLKLFILLFVRFFLLLLREVFLLFHAAAPSLCPTQ